MTDTVDYCKDCFHPKSFHIFTVENDRAPCGEMGCECVNFVHGETRVTSSTGAQKGTKEARYDLIPIPALDALARLYGKGAEKYAEHNWRLGYEYSKSYAAAQRHMNAFWSGENIDPETQIPHTICAAFHMFALTTYLTEHPEFDDRFETTHLQPQTSIQEMFSQAFEGMANPFGVQPYRRNEDISKEEAIENAAQWVAEQPDGETITFANDFTPDEINQIFNRAAEIAQEEKPTDG